MLYILYLFLILFFNTHIQEFRYEEGLIHHMYLITYLVNYLSSSVMPALSIRKH